MHPEGLAERSEASDYNSAITASKLHWAAISGRGV